MLEDTNEELARCTVDVFEHSQYFADQLVRHPELLREVRRGLRRRGRGAPALWPRGTRSNCAVSFAEQMVRIQSDSVYHRVPVFKTLKRTSDLAESVIAAAYEIALREALASAPPVELRATSRPTR